jgi:hypothetical protein
VEVDGEEIKWYFKPTEYQTAAWASSKKEKPAYAYRDYSFDASGVAMLNGKRLSADYQMKVYAPGTYTDTYANLVENKGSKSKYVYVDIFYWDNKWEKPKYNGTTMSQVAAKDAYSLADYEIKNHYYTYGYTLTGSTSYFDPNPKAKSQYHTLFRAYEAKESGSGTVTVKDRFGNEYSRTISW